MELNIQQIDNWFVHALRPKDWYTVSTLPVHEWLKNTGKALIEPAKMDAWTDFMQAVSAVTKHPNWRWPLREEPRTCYDLLSDTHYFIFKIDYSGTTFVVSRRKMPELAAELI